MERDAQRERLLAFVAADVSAMAVLGLVRALDLPDWAIGAGFLRNRLEFIELIPDQLNCYRRHFALCPHFMFYH